MSFLVAVASTRAPRCKHGSDRGGASDDVHATPSRVQRTGKTVVVAVRKGTRESLESHVPSPIRAPCSGAWYPCCNVLVIICKENSTCQSPLPIRNPKSAIGTPLVPSKKKRGAPPIRPVFNLHPNSNTTHYPVYVYEMIAEKFATHNPQSRSRNTPLFGQKETTSPGVLGPETGGRTEGYFTAKARS